MVEEGLVGSHRADRHKGAKQVVCATLCTLLPKQIPDRFREVALQLDVVEQGLERLAQARSGVGWAGLVVAADKLFHRQLAVAPPAKRFAGHLLAGLGLSLCAGQPVRAKHPPLSLVPDELLFEELDCRVADRLVVRIGQHLVAVSNLIKHPIAAGQVDAQLVVELRLEFGREPVERGDFLGQLIGQLAKLHDVGHQLWRILRQLIEGLIPAAADRSGHRLLGGIHGGIAFGERGIHSGRAVIR